MANISKSEIENRFGFHPANDTTKGKHQVVRVWFAGIATDLVDLVPDGREQSLMITALEEASMWANAGIARNEAELKLGE